MSAQAGIWNFDGKPVDEALLQDLCDALRPQAPHGEYRYLDGCVAVAYLPFHTTHESLKEKQPFISCRGFVVTWDGRLDNGDELTEDLRINREVTDVSIVAAAFDQWEEGSLARLVGDWALTVWKPQDQELVLATDYLSIRHLFYHIDNKQVCWATDLAPLVLSSRSILHVDCDYVANYLANDPESHSTPYQEIRQVGHGSFVRVKKEYSEVIRYWSFNPGRRIQYHNDREYEDHFQSLFRQSVRRRLRSNGSVLAELSGGIDSSSIVCMADDILTKQETGLPNLETLSYYDKTEPHGDDWIYFPIVESRRGRIGHHIDAGAIGNSPDLLDRSEFLALPDYFGAGCESARAQVMHEFGYRVVLSGIGGDEFMGGIPEPRAQLADRIVQMKPRQLTHELIAWSLIKRKPWIHILWNACSELLPVSIAQHVLREARLENWIDRSFAKEKRISLRRISTGETFGLRLPSRRSYIAGLSAMAKKMAKRKSRLLMPEESRFPYLDQNLVEFILSIPADQILRPGERRSLMRRSLRRIVPQQILDRRTKQFRARTPVVNLREQIEGLRVVFAPSFSSQFGFIDDAAILRAMAVTTTGKRVNTFRLLRSIALEIWLRDVVGRNLVECDATSLSAVLHESLQAPA